MNPHIHNERFAALLKQLNTAQRLAVERIDGPLLAVAGPGTGKTQLLAARIGQILLTTDTSANNILCLTFTDAGVQAMRERLLQFIGPEAHRVHITTFHAFCNSIIQDHPDLFGRYDLETLSDLDGIEIRRQLLSELPPDHVLRRGYVDFGYTEPHLKHLFQIMKRENWSPSYLSEAIDEYLEDLPNRKAFVYQNTKKGTYNKGELKQAKVNEEVNKMERLRQAGNLLPVYNRLLSKMKRYDYDDMILWVIREFSQNENLLRAYQERYFYYLVDEFQDTNGAQNDLLHLLADFWGDNPNLFAVGDDDQSIYEFQGARIKNIREFTERYAAHVAVVPLSDNYRSTQHILDAAGSLIGLNQERLSQQLTTEDGELFNKQLVAASEPKDYAYCGIVAYVNPVHEQVAILNAIEELRAKQVKLSEIAIICRKHDQYEAFMTIFDKKDIPYNTRRPANVLLQPIAKQILRILSYLQREYDEPHSASDVLYEILHYDCWYPRPNALQLANFAAHLANNENLVWREELLKDEALAPFAQILEDLLIDIPNLPLPDLVERVVNRTGILRQALSQQDRVWAVQTLNTFYNFTAQEYAKAPFFNVSKFLALCNTMQSSNLRLPIERNISVGDGVHLLTAHGAKGLEYEYVFMPSCNSNAWETARSNNKRFSLPDTLTLSSESDEEESMRRLFYVGMTRAKQFLQLSFYQHNQKGEAVPKTKFLDELLDKGLVGLEEKTVSEADVLQQQILKLTETAIPRAPQLPSVVLDKLLENFALSASSLNRFLNCPLEFYYQNILGIPTGTSEYAAYGLAVHQALERAFRRMLAHPNQQFAWTEGFMSDFDTALTRQKRFFSPDSFRRHREQAQANLPTYYAQRSRVWQKNVRVEQRYPRTTFEDIRLTGIIDKVVLQADNTVLIADYKTGKLDESHLAAVTLKSQGGKYRRQLLFYKLLFENGDPLSLPVRKGAIDYLTPDDSGEYPLKEINLEADEMIIFRQIVRDTWKRIMAHDFHEGCGKLTCRWCNFSRHNIAPDTFNNPDIDDLDDGY